MEAEKRIGDLISITTRLIDVLERENAMLRDRKYGDLSKILDEKATIARVYEARVLGFGENRGALDEVSTEMREQFVELAHKVDALMAENTTMLQVAVVASRRVVDLIAEAVKETAPSAGTYSNRGRKAQAPLTGGSMSISVNETL